MKIKGCKEEVKVVRITYKDKRAVYQINDIANDLESMSYAKDNVVDIVIGDSIELNHIIAIFKNFEEKEFKKKITVMEEDAICIDELASYFGTIPPFKEGD